MDDEELNEIRALALPPHDPTDLGFPPTLPLELAAKTMPIAEICESYGISHAKWQELRLNVAFQQAVADAKGAIEQQGGSFKAKIKTVAEALLPRMMELAQSKDLVSVPASVQADLIKTAIRVAGLDASIDQKSQAAAGAIAQASITINLR